MADMNLDKKMELREGAGGGSAVHPVSRVRRYLTVFAALLMCFVMMVAMTACAAKADQEEEAELDELTAEELQEELEEAEEEAANMPDVVKTIDGVDEDLGPLLPIQIESITLYEDGSVAIVPTDDLKKNEIKDDAEAVYPFEESGKVKDVEVLAYGNGGYRTVVAVMEDGTISAVNGGALVEDHIFAVIDNVAGRENFVSVRNESDESGTFMVGTTETGEDVVLDYSLSF